MITYLKRLVEERNALTSLMSAMTDKAVADDRELTEHERGLMAQHQTRCAELDSQIEEHKAQVESTRAWASLQDHLKGIEDAPEPVRGRVIERRDAEVAPTWGEAFIESRAVTEYRGAGTSERIEVPGPFETRAPIDTSWVNTPPFIYSPPGWSMTTPLLDAIGKQRVSTGEVDWVTFGGAYPLAGVVAEGALKPEAAITPTEHSAKLNTYAHWVGITRQALEDLPRIQSIIETHLRGGLLRKIEADTATALTTDPGIPSVVGPDLLSGIRVALGEVQSAGYANANTVLLNPADYADLDLLIMSTAGLAPQSQTKVWGLNVIAAGAVPEGTAYVGDFNTGMTLFDRGVANVFMSDSHADFFIRNTLLVLAETRCLPVVTEPLALAEVTVEVVP